MKTLDDAEYLQPKLDEYYYHDREEGMTDFMKRFNAYLKHMQKLGVTQNPDHPAQKILRLIRMNLDYGVINLHFGAFIPAVELLGSDEQVKKWIPLSRDFKIIGAYAQTELGHGSDVQSLQTTATYDVDT